MAVRKTKKGLALKRWFKEDWKDVRTVRSVVDKREKKEALTVDPQKELVKKLLKQFPRCHF